MIKAQDNSPSTLNDAIQSILDAYYDRVLQHLILGMIECAKKEDEKNTEDQGASQALLIEDLCYAINKPYDKYQNFITKQEKSGQYEENLRVISFACSGGSANAAEDRILAPFLTDRLIAPVLTDVLRQEIATYFRTKLDDFFLSEEWEIEDGKGGTMTTKNSYVHIYQSAKDLTPTQSPQQNSNPPSPVSDAETINPSAESPQQNSNSPSPFTAAETINHLAGQSKGLAL